MTDDCKLSPAERGRFAQWLNRLRPGLIDRHDTSSWRDFTAEPCPGGCSQGRVVVPVRDGTFGWVMGPCGRCCSPESTGTALASQNSNDEAQSIE